MRKQELIHLHALLVELRRYCSQEAELTEYKTLGISATMIDRRKFEHKEAIFALAEAITDDLHHERTLSEPPSTG